ncbi:MAG: hypothetical protein WCG03_09200 [Kiritimatiellales bacterium]
MVGTPGDLGVLAVNNLPMFGNTHPGLPAFAEGYGGQVGHPSVGGDYLCGLSWWSKIFPFGKAQGGQYLEPIRVN